jgi:tetratricopeptide (TPR) repeat protein
MPEPSNSVFISYRRDVGGILAMALYQHLTEQAIDAFYDIENIRAGQFDTIILKQIAGRPYFLLVLTPGTLERCHDPNDWLRREIDQAVATQRVVVPVYTPSFDFSDIERLLPDELGQTVRRFNGQELPQRWFRFAVQQLVEEFLVPIQVGNVAVSDAEQAVVDQLRERAQAAPTVTQVQLSAQEYYERAYARTGNDLAGKIADYSEAIRLDPTYVCAYINRGLARRGREELEGAISDYTEAIRLDPTYALAYVNRGFARRAKGDLAGAMHDSNEAIRLDPSDARGYISRGLARRATGDAAGADADLATAAHLDPTDAAGYLNRGVAPHDDELEAVIRDSTDAIGLDPNDALAYLNRGRARRAKGDLDGAISDSSEAIRLSPKESLAYLNRGLARRAKGDLDGAISDYTDAIRLDPDDPRAYISRGVARRAKGDTAGADADLLSGARRGPGKSAAEARPSRVRQVWRRR